MQHTSLAGRSPVGWPGNAADEQAERLVANLMLAILSCHMQAVDTAHTYLERAYSLVKRLSSHAQTVRSTRPLMLARIHVTAGELVDTLLMPLAGGVLQAPSIDFASLMSQDQNAFGYLPTIDLVDVDIAYFVLRIRTARVAASIASLEGVHDIQTLEPSATEVLRQCLQTETRCPDPLEAADDYFGLARGFIKLQQTPLAVLCLDKAQTFLESSAVSSGTKSYVAMIDDMTKRLHEIRRGLAVRAS